MVVCHTIEVYTSKHTRFIITAYCVHEFKKDKKRKKHACILVLFFGDGVDD